MGKFVDLTGQRFGKLTVVEPSEKRSRGRFRWKCICDCGMETHPLSFNLMSGSTTTCGTEGCNLSKNIFYEQDGCMVGITQKGKKFYFDKIDFEFIKNYTWCIGSQGYPSTRFNRKIKLMHRIITDAQEGQYVDHINHDTCDNRRENLRICTNAENLHNTNKRKNTISKYKGVYCYKRGKKRYNAYIKHDGRNRSLGYYETEEEAALAYNKAATELFGEFAKLNDI
jgi:hypothetical protein